MQTFLPYSDFQQSLACLDYRRLGKQRVEAYQLICVIEKRPNKQGKVSRGWGSHPAALMWHGYVDALKQYHNLSIQEWIRRGYKNNMQLEAVPDSILLPSWVGNAAFHASHRSNLLRKDPAYYSKFGWQESPDLPYVWPGR